MKREPYILPLTIAAILALLVFSRGASAAEPAIVKLGSENAVLEITFDSGEKLVVTSKGTSLAAGTYMIKSLRLLKQDEKKRVWEMRSEGSLSTLATLTVNPGQEKVLDTGGAIHVNYFIWPHGTDPTSVLFRINFRGGYSENYYPGAYFRGKRPAAPAYRISTEEGKVLAEGRCTNENGTAFIRWTVPKGLEEQCKIEIKPTMGPFEWEAASTTFSPVPRN